MPNNKPPALTLVRSLTINGPEYETTIEVQETAVTSTDRALTITQPRSADEEDDVVVLVWAEWAELRDYVDAWWDAMPDDSVVDAQIMCGATYSDGVDCALPAGHAPVGRGGVEDGEPETHVTPGGLVFTDD